MICEPCRVAADIKPSPMTAGMKKDLHEQCRGGTWCCCQHKERRA
jgi:hypothetical protein